MTTLSALGKRWIEASPSAEALTLARALDLHPQVASLLWQRGYRDTDQILAFLDPRLQALGDPFQLTDLRLAAERILRAIKAREKIAIFGDYDVDGITSSALLWRVLRKLGADVETFLPLRMEEGYGLSQDGVERCVEEHHPALLIAVDCGTTAVQQVAWLREKGVEVVIIDHHALPPELPDANALVNPQRDGVGKLDYFCSVGLVFKVCHGLLKLTGEGKRPIDLRDYLDLVAIGTVADIVPLVEENRILVRRGLRQLEQSHWVGLRALIEVSQVTYPVTAQDVGFRLGPRLNASGRLGDAMLSLRLLQTDDANEATNIASELNRNNRERQAVEMDTLHQAEAQLEEAFDPARDWGIVLAGKSWHWGVIGIVASRLQKRYHRPTIIIGLNDEGLGKGSGRSIDGISIVRALNACSSHLTLFGGHDMAAGLNILAENVDGFRAAFSKEIRTQAGPEDAVFQSTLELSGTISLPEVSDQLYRQMEELAPFGRNNPEPIFLFEKITYARPAKHFGNNHVKLFLRGEKGEIEAVGFGLGQHDWTKPPSRLAGTLDWDDYRNRVQLRIIDWQL